MPPHIVFSAAVMQKINKRTQGSLESAHNTTWDWKEGETPMILFSFGLPGINCHRNQNGGNLAEQPTAGTRIRLLPAPVVAG
jgi:hypothetical protein